MNDIKIRKLKNGQAAQISESNGVRVTAERSGNGKTLRIVRHTKDGFIVIRTCKF